LDYGWVGEHGRRRKKTAKEVANIGFIILLSSLLIWPVIPILFGMELSGFVAFGIAAWWIFWVGVVVLIVALIMKIKSMTESPTTPVDVSTQTRRVIIYAIFVLVMFLITILFGESTDGSF
jgi:hypothetical protein